MSEKKTDIIIDDDFHIRVQNKLNNKLYKQLQHLKHGRETYAVDYGPDFVIKRPLPIMSDDARAKWLTKQHRTQEIINEIRAVNNPTYNIPRMIHIHDQEYQILEERAHGIPLTRDLYRSLSRRQQYEIVTSIGGFLVDMNELKPVQDIVKHRISQDIKFNRFDKFITTKMPLFFTETEISYISHIRDSIRDFEYETRMAWSHCDLNPGNVLYDPENSKIYFIDFAEAGYRYIYRDIFSPLQIELGIYKQVYNVYTKMHNNKIYTMPSSKDKTLRQIMKYRLMIVHLKRFIKAADDMRVNPAGHKSEQNNCLKRDFIREQIAAIAALERQFDK